MKKKTDGYTKKYGESRVLKDLLTRLTGLFSLERLKVVTMKSNPKKVLEDLKIVEKLSKEDMKTYEANILG